MFFIMLLHHYGSAQSEGVTRASASGSDVVTINAVLFWVGIELFDDCVDILGLSGRLGVWSISVVDEEHDAVGAKGHVAEGFGIDEGTQSEIGASMQGDVGFVVRSVKSVEALKLDDSDFALTIESFQSEFRETLVESSGLVSCRRLVQCFQMCRGIGVLGLVGCFGSFKISPKSSVEPLVIIDPTLLAPFLWRDLGEY